MEAFDVLNEIDAKGRLRNVKVGGYITRVIPPPPIFTTETIADTGKFVEIKLLYIQETRGSKKLVSGTVCGFVDKGVQEQDFHEFRGSLSLGGREYSRLVTLFNFKKGTVTEGVITWGIEPVYCKDIDVYELHPQLQTYLWDFVDNPHTFELPTSNFFLQPSSEVISTKKVDIDLKGIKTNLPIIEKPTHEYEDLKGYLIDREYEVLKEVLRYPVIALNLEDFEGDDEGLIGYIDWLLEGVVDFIDKQEYETMSKTDRTTIVLTETDIESIPYIKLKRGVFTWGL